MSLAWQLSLAAMFSLVFCLPFFLSRCSIFRINILLLLFFSSFFLFSFFSFLFLLKGDTKRGRIMGRILFLFFLLLKRDTKRGRIMGRVDRTGFFFFFFFLKETRSEAEPWPVSIGLDFFSS